MTSLCILSRKMAAPKDAWTGKAPRTFIPSVGDHELPFLLGGLVPAERDALHWIAENADVLEVEGQTYLLAPAGPALLDTLAAVGANAEDLENDLLDEPEEGDGSGTMHGFNEDYEAVDEDGEEATI